MNRLLPKLCISLLGILGSWSLPALEAPPQTDELRFVVMMSRHGIRSPTWKPDQINEYSVAAWPDFRVPPGFLTPHGRNVMKLFGAYDRAYLAKAGLFSATGCAGADHVYIWTDSDQRTIETGRALAEGMFPDCSVEVRSLKEGEPDPLFRPVLVDLGHPNRRLALAALAGRIGGTPAALLRSYRPALETMRQILLGCNPDGPCPPEGRNAKKSFQELPASLDTSVKDRLVELQGPMATASVLAQSFMLEYLEGMTGKDLGWGRLNVSNLQDMMAVHIAYFDLVRRTPYIARASGSNLLSHMLKAMEQSITGKPVKGAVGKLGDRLAILVGHDTNQQNLAGMLRLSWLMEGYQRDDTPPGGALVFELWRKAGTGDYSVRTYFMSQTMNQMRNTVPVTLESPPAISPVFVPGCSTESDGFACSWDDFRRTIEAAIDPAFVKP